MRPVLALCVVAAVACVGQTQRIAPLPCPSSGIDVGTLPPAAQRPRPIELLVPPLPIPSSLRNVHATIRVVVDTAGRVVPDSVMVCGIPDVAYSRRFAAEMVALRFVPGRGPTGPIVSPAVLVYDF